LKIKEIYEKICAEFSNEPVYGYCLEYKLTRLTREEKI
jgi:hypothetical protein